MRLMAFVSSCSGTSSWANCISWKSRLYYISIEARMCEAFYLKKIPYLKRKEYWAAAQRFETIDFKRPHIIKTIQTWNMQSKHPRAELSNQPYTSHTKCGGPPFAPAHRLLAGNRMRPAGLIWAHVAFDVGCFVQMHFFKQFTYIRWKLNSRMFKAHLE